MAYEAIVCPGREWGPVAGFYFGAAKGLDVFWLIIADTATCQTNI